MGSTSFFSYLVIGVISSMISIRITALIPTCNIPIFIVSISNNNLSGSNRRDGFLENRRDWACLAAWGSLIPHHVERPRYKNVDMGLYLLFSTLEEP